MTDKAEELAKLKKDLEQLKGRRPEHCSGTSEYIGEHKTSPRLWAEIEDLEDRIKALEKELAGS